MESAEQLTVELLATTEPPPPVVIVTASGNQPQQSFRLLDEADITATAEADTSAAAEASTKSLAGEETEEAAAEAENGQAAEQAPSPTPEPTFTPPSAPEDSPWDHYWLNRPVPEGSTVWTDKAYPYGSTRGGTLRTHHGVEFNVAAGTQVLAAAGGTVRVAGDDLAVQLGATPDFYGNVVVIEHGFQADGLPIFTLYGHLSEILVIEGQEVKAQEVIGLSGASGVADGAHLHFEVRVGENGYDATRNPLLWLYPFPERGVVAGRVLWPDGSLASNVPLRLRRVDAPSAYAATTTYADDSVNADANWQENFALDDVVAGFYELSIGSGDDRVTAEFWVYPYRTSYVELTLEQ